MSAPLPPSLTATPELGRWISLERQGFVAYRTGKVELGQGIQTALSQIVAEEIGADLARIVPLPVDTDSAPYEGVTAGSLSVEVSGQSLRLAAAQARAALIAAAAVRLDTDAADLSLLDGAILQSGKPSGLTLWSVSGDVDWAQPVQAGAALARTGSAIGTSPHRPDLEQKYRGSGFIHDLSFPGMLHARILHQPARLARLDRVDTDWLARRHPDVSLVRNTDFLALVAASEAAVQAAVAEADRFVTWDTASARWTPPQTPDAETLRTDPAPEPGTGTYTATYSRPNIAHASIGLCCAIAVHAEGRLTIWTHSQGIFELRDEVARVLDLPPESLRVIHAHGAGCYGHNGADDVALDAAILALAHPGRHLRVQWTRAQELSRAPLGAAMIHTIQARLEAGRVTALWSDVVSQPHAQRPGNGGFAQLQAAEALDTALAPTSVADLPINRGGGASRNAVSLYDIPQSATIRLDATSPVRTSALRSLGGHLNVFAIESAMDDLSAEAGADPLAFRLAHLGCARARAVLSRAAAMAGWPGPALPEGQAMGLAVARYKNKGAWLAAVAQVEVAEEVHVRHLWLACDAGLLINPEGARNQIEGGAIQATSWTLKEAVPIEDGRAALTDWDSYPILRFSEVPQIETAFLSKPDDPPLGAGEASQGPVSAAIGNAVARALGARIHDLPLTRERIMAALLRE